ncbi:MAG: hypothetical protein AB7L17_00640 [Ilumatobacteraceae bacterium]
MGRERLGRVRWAAIGAAVAVSIGGGGLAIGHAAVSSGERSTFVSITPCRIFDTRPDTQVGPRGTPLAPNETYTQTVRGTNGSCTIPTDAVAVAMNVTAVNGTSGSFLTIWPSDVDPRPNASSLNWQPGQPATPNKVDVRLSADGNINLYNLSGSVDVLADVVGYYADHNHDDRYLTKNGSVVIGHPAFVAQSGTNLINGCVSTTAGSTLEASIPLPVGVTVTGFHALVVDGVANDLTVTLYRTTDFVTAIAATSTSGAPGLTTIEAAAATPERVDTGEYFFARFVNPAASHAICGMEIFYTS